MAEVAKMKNRSEDKPEPEAWSEQVEQDLHTRLIDEKLPFPSMEELQHEASDIEKTIAEEEKKEAKESEESELNELMGFMDDPAGPETPRAVKFSEVPKSENAKGKQKVGHVLCSDHKTSIDSDYQESFASQEEAAQIRNHIDSIDSRLSIMEGMIQSLLEERKNLPDHLTRHKQDINRQFTVMVNKLNNALEKNITSDAVAQAAKDVNVMTVESDHVLTVLQTDLDQPPSKSASVAKNNPISKRRNRVRIVE